MARQNNNAIKRGGFSSNFGVLAATLGSAVGLGNIWKFPYLTGANGGAGFLLIYLMATLVIGLPVMIAEITIGRHTKANPITALKKLSPKGQPWWLLGVAGMFAAFLILSFYSEVVAWIFAYVFKAFSGSILSSDRRIPMGQVLMITFFVLAAVAATGAMLSLMEVPVVILHERFALSRPKATLITITGLMLIGSSCALTNNVLANFKLFGLNMFDLFDFVSSNLLLPIGGILIALFVGWVWGIEKFTKALSNDGELPNARMAHAVFFLLRYPSDRDAQ